MSLNEYGLTRGDKLVAGRTEEEVYQALGVAWIPPELREGAGEIAHAKAGTLPDLVSMKDLRGVLHLHTDFSDGVNTLAEMAERRITAVAGDVSTDGLGLNDHDRQLFAGCDVVINTAAMYEVGIPRSLPYLFASLKVAVTLAFVGAVIAETVAANRGIGYLMISASARFEVPLVFAGLSVVAAMGVALYAVFAIIESRLTGWAYRGQVMT